MHCDVFDLVRSRFKPAITTPSSGVKVYRATNELDTNAIARPTRTKHGSIRFERDTAIVDVDEDGSSDAVAEALLPAVSSDVGSCVFVLLVIEAAAEFNVALADLVVAVGSS